MAFSDANRTKVKIIEEVIWGVTPTGPQMKTLPIASEGFKADVKHVTAGTIRADKNVSDITKVGGGAGGPITFEFSFEDFDDIIKAGMQSSWATAIVSNAVSSARYASNYIQADSSALNAVIDNQWLRTKNSTTTANNGDWLVTDVSSETPAPGQSRIYLADASSGNAASFTSEVFAAATTAKGEVIRNGVSLKSFTIEKASEDISIYQQFRGQRVSDLEIKMESESILMGAATFAGKGMTVTSTTIASTTVAESTNPKLNASGNVARIYEGGNAISGISFKTITIKINTNTREQPKIGSDILAGIATGVTEVTGTAVAYFEDAALVNKYLNSEYTSLKMQIEDDNSKGYFITIPRMKYTSEETLATGPNNDVMVSLEWGAVIDSANTYAIQIDKLD